MYNYSKPVLSPYDPAKLKFHSISLPEDDIISNWGLNVKKTVSFDDVVHFIDKEDIVTYVKFGCGVAFYPETPQKLVRSIEKGVTSPDPVKNPSAFPATINITVLLMNSIALLSVWTREFFGTWLQQLLCHSTTLMKHTLCPISTLNQQLTNLEQIHIRCSFHCERCTVKRRDCASASHSFKQIT